MKTGHSNPPRTPGGRKDDWMHLKRLKKQWTLHVMMIPAIALAVLFCYMPMYGVVIAFQKFLPAKGLYGAQTWVGLDNFRYLFMLPNTVSIIRNTLLISVFKLIGLIVIPVATAVLLNEVRAMRFKRSLQTLISFPHFISWIILAALFSNLLAHDGLLNRAIAAMGLEKIGFLSNKSVFPWTMIVTDIWKEFGYSSIIYLATLTSIDTQLYEAAKVDGASRFQCIRYITLPGMTGIIVLMSLLSLGNLFSAGFDQIYNLLNSVVMETGDIIDTYVYRVGLQNFKYGPASAMSFFKSIISCLLISVSYFMAYKFADYRIF